MESIELDHLVMDLVNHFLDVLDDWAGIQTPAFRPRCEELARIALQVAVQQERRHCLELVQSHHLRCGKYCSVGPDTSHDADCLANLVQALKEDAP